MSQHDSGDEFAEWEVVRVTSAENGGVLSETKYIEPSPVLSSAQSPTDPPDLVDSTNHNDDDQKDSVLHTNTNTTAKDATTYADDTWPCNTCNARNEVSYGFCPHCGARNPSNAAYNGDDDGKLFALVGSIESTQEFNPGESRQCGWILQNTTDTYVQAKCRLVSIGGDKIHITKEVLYEFSAKPHEKMYLFVEGTAPPKPGTYHGFWRLECISDSRDIAPVLELKMEVKAQFNDSKEKKIAEIMGMGFARDVVIAMLEKHHWRTAAAANELVDSSADS